MNTVQVFIITRNRPDTLLIAVNSVLNQTFRSMEVIVSDNSTNDDTYNLLRPLFSKLKYIRRNPCIETSMDHINTVLHEATSQYVVVFHDDDEMLPNMVESLWNEISKNGLNSAAGANAFIVKGKRKTLAFKDGNTVINNVDQIVDRYNDKGIAPFPSYMYNMNVIKDLSLNREHGHKYCDVAFLADVARKGPVVYVGQPLMNYNIHPEQDSQSLDFIGHVKLTNYLRTIVNEKSVLIGLRLYHIYSNAIIGYLSGEMIYRKNVASLLFKYSSKNYYLKYIIRYLQNIIHA